AVAHASEIGRHTPRWWPRWGSSIGTTASSDDSIRSSHVLPLREDPKIQASRSSSRERSIGRPPLARSHAWRQSYPTWRPPETTPGPRAGDPLSSGSRPTGSLWGVSSIPDKPSLEGLEAKWRKRWADEGTYRFDRTKPRDQVFSI